ncbi:MAG: hypothetical protein V7K47_29290 [Nostoc sp.]
MGISYFPYLSISRLVSFDYRQVNHILPLLVSVSIMAIAITKESSAIYIESYL